MHIIDVIREQEELDLLYLQEGYRGKTMRHKSKWLVAWFAPDGKFRDAVERLTPGCPRKWAERRCSEGETYDIWNIGNPDDEKRVRASLEERK